MKMRLLLALVGLAIGFVVPAFAQEKDTVDPQTLQQLQAIDKKFDEAFNKNDAAAVAAFYTEGAVAVTPLGVFSGRQGIEKYFEGVFQRSHLTDHANKLDHVYTLGTDLCLIGGWAVNSSGVAAGGHRTLVCTRNGDTWKIRVMLAVY